MISVPNPMNEAQRLAELDRYDILDTLPEAAFDDVVALAAEICGTPISAITFVDQRRNWLKAAIGLGLGDVPREQGFCSHTILDASVLVVEDTHVDGRFHENPFVKGDPNVRFYAGAPLITPNGYALGALCVVDRVPRQMTDNQVRMLGRLARQVVAHLELRRLNEQVTNALADRDRAEQQVRMLHNLSVSIAEAHDSATAVRSTLERLCSHLGWQAGAAWLPDLNSAALSCFDVFVAPEANLERFRAVTQALSLPLSEGLPGRAYSDREPVWIEDVQQAPHLPRGEVAAALGLVTGAAFPVKTNNDVIAVLEFWSQTPRPLDANARALIAGVTAELGGALRRKRAEDALKHSELQFRSVTNAASDAIVIADGRSVIVAWNAAAEKIFGHTSAEAVGQSLALIIPERMRQAHQRGMERVLSSGQSDMAGKTVELVAVRKDGSEFPIEMSVATWAKPPDRFFSGIIRDITTRKQMEAALRASEAELRHQAMHDALTGLPNRRAVLDAAQRELSRVSRDKQPISVAIIDLDHFKQINDTHGHAVGDEVLREAAQRIQAAVRVYDGLGRYGGEEFLVVLPGCDEQAALAITERILRALSTHDIVTVAGGLHVSCSIGVAVFSSESIGEWIARADAALYRAKRGGRNRVELSTTAFPRLAG